MDNSSFMMDERGDTTSAIALCADHHGFRENRTAIVPPLQRRFPKAFSQKFFKSFLTKYLHDELYKDDLNRKHQRPLKKSNLQNSKTLSLTTKTPTLLSTEISQTFIYHQNLNKIIFYGIFREKKKIINWHQWLDCKRNMVECQLNEEPSVLECTVGNNTVDDEAQWSPAINQAL